MDEAISVKKLEWDFQDKRAEDRGGVVMEVRGQSGLSFRRAEWLELITVEALSWDTRPIAYCGKKAKQSASRSINCREMGVGRQGEVNAGEGGPSPSGGHSSLGYGKRDKIGRST